MKKEVGKVPGVNEYYGLEAKKFKKTVRGMEDVLEEYGFNQLITSILTNDSIYKENLEFLGDRFLENLAYVDLNGEKNDIVILPEGTMKTYDYIKGNNLEKAKIFYSEAYVRNEDFEEIEKGKTRGFNQIGFEIFNYPKFESTVEAIKLSDDLLKSTGLKDHSIRIADKRLLKGLIDRYDENERNIILSIIDMADDNPEKFRELYQFKGGKNKKIENEMVNFLSLNTKNNLSIIDLEKITKESIVYNSGIENLKAIIEEVSEKTNLILLPFMAKSWDACDEIMFDGRQPNYDSAICGGGNLTYNKYKPDAPKSGAGIGVTRIFDLLKKNN